MANRLIFVLLFIMSLSSCEERLIYSEQTYTVLDTPYSVKKQVYKGGKDSKIVLSLYKNGQYVDMLTWRAFKYPLDSGNHLDVIFDKDSVYTQEGLFVEDSKSKSPVFVNLDNKEENSYYYCLCNNVATYGWTKKRILTCDRAWAAETECRNNGIFLRIRSYSNTATDFDNYRIMGLDYDDNDNSDKTVPFAFSSYVDIKPKFMGTEEPSVFEGWLKEELMNHWEESRYFYEPTQKYVVGFRGHFHFVLTEDGHISYLSGHGNIHHSIIEEQIMKSEGFWEPGYKDSKPIKTIVHFSLYSFNDTETVHLAR